MSAEESVILRALEIDQDEIERYEGAFVSQEHPGHLVISARTGGDNRATYHNDILTHHAAFAWTEDVPGDSTYAYYYFRDPRHAVKILPDNALKAPTVMYDQDGMTIDIDGPLSAPVVNVTANGQRVTLSATQARVLCEELLLILIPGATRRRSDS